MTRTMARHVHPCQPLAWRYDVSKPNTARGPGSLMVIRGFGEAERHPQVLGWTVQELRVRRSTTVPSWWALWVLVRYRSSRNFRSSAYLGARLGAEPVEILLQRMRHGQLTVRCTPCAYWFK